MLTFVLVIIVIVHFVLDQYLSYLNYTSWDKPVSNIVSEVYSADRYEQAKKYNKERFTFTLFASGFKTFIIVVLLLTGSFSILLSWTEMINSDPVWSVLIYLAILYVIFDILNLPFDIYSTFVLENRYDFNRTTPTTFITDKIKGYIIGGALIGSMLAMIIILFQLFNQGFWLYAWIGIAIVMLLINIYYARLILPLFNKLNPLDNGELKDKIELYCSKAGFRLANLFVIDGSKRSSKANAFFSGFGNKKTIVLFDTLIEKLNPDEIIAVLAHEVGHYKKKHTLKFYLISVLNIGLILFLFSFAVNNVHLSIALGADETKFALGFIAFSILYTPVSFLTGIATNILSRKNEFEADEFASNTANGQQLVNALKKLSSDHLSNLNPHPAYVFVNYSHPPLLERLMAIERHTRK